MSAFRILFFLFCFLISLPSPAHSAALETEWKEQREVALRMIAAGPIDYHGSSHQLLGLHFKMQPSWKVYWRTPGDAGAPITLDWKARSKNIASLELMWPAPHRKVDVGDLESYGYLEEVVIPVFVTPKDPSQPIELTAEAGYASCADICVFYSEQLSLTVSPDEKSPENATLITEYLSKTPQPNGQFGITISELSMQGQTLSVLIHSLEPLTDLDVFIEGTDAYRFPKPTITERQALNGIDYLVTYQAEQLVSGTNLVEKELRVTAATGHHAIEHTMPVTSTPLSDVTSDVPVTLWLILVFAYLGGLILNIMPCVLPVLSLKVLGVLSHGGSKAGRVRTAFLFSTAGILCSFLLLGLVVVILKSAGHAVGWGFHFQEPIFVVVLLLIVLLFTANLWGLFEVQLPHRLTNFLFTKSQKHEKSLLGHFLSGCLATILATPCTAPFVTPAISFALTQGSLIILLIFVIMGVGLATPYLLFAAFPAWISRLPKPGKWMVTVKKLLGVLMLATALWLGFVLYAQLISTQTADADASAQIHWEAFDATRIPTLIEGGHVVFVDVTADWCITCKFNKINVMHSSEVADALQADHVITMKADYTKPSPEIRAFLEQHNRYGIPFNIVYGPNARDGIILPEILTNQVVLDALGKAVTNP